MATVQSLTAKANSEGQPTHTKRWGNVDVFNDLKYVLTSMINVYVIITLMEASISFVMLEI